MSVVIPVYRSERFIGACMNSILAQRRPVDQVVLVDDGGDDASIDIALHALRGADVECVVVRQPRNGGVGRARNAGVAAVRGDLVWFLDSDDLAHPLFTTVMSAAFADPSIDLAACRTEYVDLHGQRLRAPAPRSTDSRVSGEDFVRMLAAGDIKAYPGKHMFRREVLGDHPFDDRRAYEDMVATARIALRSRRVAMIDTPLYRYRLRAGSLSHSVNTNTAALFEMGDEMTTVISEVADGPRRQRLIRRFVYREVLIPAAHLAMRATHAGDTGNPVVDGLLVDARRRTSLRDCVPLLMDRQIRSAVFAFAMSAAPAVYSGILRRRPEQVGLG
ncbi:glycosyltransferase family 2 protein [Gordonia sp. NPDC003424]